jgi:glycosyltransferase involved in cell wall biosynthesis
MRYSIIIPTYKRRRLLRKCIDSLFASASASVSFQIIVVDDESSFQTRKMLTSLRRKHRNIAYLHTPHLGPGAARNAGLSKARGDIVVFLDDDCAVERDWFSILESIFDNPHISIVGGSLENSTNSYVAWSAHLLNFSSWLAAGTERVVNDIPAAHAAYRRVVLQGHRFPELPPDIVYEDALLNHELKEEGNTIWFFPQLKAMHRSWEGGKGLKRFFSQQRKAARGFIAGGYLVHGVAGKILFHAPFLNLFCPRLLCVFWRCFRYGKLLRFLWCLPLLVAGECSRGAIICGESWKSRQSLK